MPRTRLHIAAEFGVNSTLQLDADQARYLSRVLRLRVGDSLLVFDGLGYEYSASITSLGRSNATLLVDEATVATTESDLKVHLVQGVSRGERMDFVVQKATELGVKRITPVLTEFGVVKLDATRAEKRREHWQKVAASACEQCGRVRLPLIDAPLPLKHWFGNKTERVDTELILKPGAATPLTRIDAPKTKVCVLIGPEGGFSDGEFEDAAIAGFRAVSLGPRVLRTETAAVATLAVLQSLWGDLR
ncbi:MAG: 16S rRNA (uracil(1498)-N(3))-methyltransferase [Gammaproteobacteria bacterium]|nr:16S rRNA (uracil(1498)-N(3))-methyltransferase [Gammaproteobacteria bacterium]